MRNVPYEVKMRSTAQINAEISHDEGPVFSTTVRKRSNRKAVIYKPSRSVTTSGSSIWALQTSVYRTPNGVESRLCWLVAT